MTPLTSAHGDRASRVEEPFRSDPGFWSGLAASADALVSLVGAAIVAVALSLMGRPVWSVVAFAVPAILLIRAGFLSTASSRRTRAAFPDRQAWRHAERRAVATSFVAVLRRRRSSP